jgi:hypothetical protein
MILSFDPEFGVRWRRAAWFLTGALVPKGHAGG